MSSRFGLWLDTDDVFAKNRVGSSTVAYTYRNLVDNGAISCKQLTGRDSESLGSVNLWRSDREISARVHRRDRRRKPQMLVRSHSVRSGSVDDVEGNFDEDIRIMLWKCTSRTSLAPQSGRICKAFIRTCVQTARPGSHNEAFRSRARTD